MSKTFKEQYLAGLITFDSIHDWIEKWHKSSNSLSLQDFLGFTNEEMQLLVKGDGSLLKKLNTKKSLTKKIASHYSGCK
jgi:hypothetical protein